MVRSGDDKGKIAKVLVALPAINKVVVEGVNTVKKTERPKQQGQKGQIVERPMPMSASNVMLAEDVKEAKKEPKKAAPAKVAAAKSAKVSAKK